MRKSSIVTLSAIIGLALLLGFSSPTLAGQSRNHKVNTKTVWVNGNGDTVCANQNARLSDHKNSRNNQRAPQVVGHRTVKVVKVVRVYDSDFDRRPAKAKVERWNRFDRHHNR